MSDPVETRFFDTFSGASEADIARFLIVDERSVARWSSGEHRASSHHASIMCALLDAIEFGVPRLQVQSLLCTSTLRDVVRTGVAFGVHSRPSRTAPRWSLGTCVPQHLPFFLRASSPFVPFDPSRGYASLKFQIMVPGPGAWRGVCAAPGVELPPTMHVTSLQVGGGPNLVPDTSTHGRVGLPIEHVFGANPVVKLEGSGGDPKNLGYVVPPNTIHLECTVDEGCGWPPPGSLFALVDVGVATPAVEPG